MIYRLGVVCAVVIGWSVLTGFSPDINVEFAKLSQAGLVQVEYDEDNDGFIDSAERYFYNASDLPDRIEVDEGCDGSVDGMIYYYYNAAGKVDREVYDEGTNGVIDEVVYYTYTASGNVATDQDDHGNNGIDNVDYYIYGANGLIERERCDSGNNGTIDEIVYYYYDASGNLVREESDWGLNSTIDSAEYLYYDAWGRLERIVNYEGGAIESVEYYRYRTLEVCACDLNADGRCDMRDWVLFGRDWGRTDCSTALPCACNLNGDMRCDMRDWVLFGKAWGRTDCPRPIDIAGTWTWREKMVSVIQGDCEDVGDVNDYQMRILQTGNRIIVDFSGAAGIVSGSITGLITGNSLSAQGMILLEGGIVLTDTIQITISSDGQVMKGTMNQVSSSPQACTGNYLISALRNPQ